MAITMLENNDLFGQMRKNYCAAHATHILAEFFGKVYQNNYVKFPNSRF